MLMGVGFVLAGAGRCSLVREVAWRMVVSRSSVVMGSCGWYLVVCVGWLLVWESLVLGVWCVWARVFARRVVRVGFFASRFVGGSFVLRVGCCELGFCESCFLRDVCVATLLCCESFVCE